VTSRDDRFRTEGLAPGARRHPLLWVPSLYFAMGIPNVTVSVLAAILYKNLGYSNEVIALATSQMYLPWALKPLWAPFMEPFRTKRFWAISMQFLIAALLGLIAFSLPLPGFFAMSLAFFWIVGFASATQDIAADAIYLTTLPPKAQARFIGVQSMFYHVGFVLAAGLLVTLTGRLHDDLGLDWPHAWMVIMAIIATIMLACGLWHSRMLPPGDSPRFPAPPFVAALDSLRETWRTFFQKPQIGMMLLVCFFYRFGEGFIEKFGPLFLLDPRTVGGLGLSNAAIGNIYGTLGTLGFLAGSVLGGLFAAKMTLRRSFLVLALAVNLPHVTYYLLSVGQPENLWLIATAVTIEKFGYGFGAVGHMLYMMQQIAPGPFRMTHYAFATAVMGLTKWASGSLSAGLYAATGHSYQLFFLFVLAASLPPILLAWLAPFPRSEDSEPKN